MDKDIELRPDGKEKKGEAKAALIKVLEKHEADFKVIIEGQEANLEGLGKVLTTYHDICLIENCRSST